jgi:hypothetical protein
LLAFVWHGESRAAQIYCIEDYETYNCGGEILIRGEIQKGDYATFRNILATKEPSIYAVSLISRGGDMEEAMKIGGLLRQRMLKTYAPLISNTHLYRAYSASRNGFICTGDECICASACFLIYAAGIKRIGSVLMVHRPRDASGTFGSKRAARASEEYRNILSRVNDYLRSMEVPDNIINKMQSTSSSDISLLTPQDTEGMEKVPSILEWEISDCGAMTSREENDFDRLKSNLNYVGNEAAAYLKYLEYKHDKIDDCTREKEQKAYTVASGPVSIL